MNPEGINVDEVLGRFNQVAGIKCLEVKALQETVLEHCEKTDPRFDVKQFRGLHTPVLTFTCGETVAGEKRYDTWLNVIFKQTRDQVFKQCIEKVIQVSTLFPPICSEEQKRSLATPHAEEWGRRLLSHELFFKLDADNTECDYKHVFEQVGNDASVLVDAQVRDFYERWPRSPIGGNWP